MHKLFAGFAHSFSTSRTPNVTGGPPSEESLDKRPPRPLRIDPDFWTPVATKSYLLSTGRVFNATHAMGCHK